VVVVVVLLLLTLVLHTRLRCQVVTYAMQALYKLFA
jgi:hypothetical protein